jgi:hypothetical protein
MPAVAGPGREAPYDIALYSDFISKAALDAYQEYPQHVALKPFIGAVRQARNASIMNFDSSLQQSSGLKPVLKPYRIKEAICILPRNCLTL